VDCKTQATGKRR